MMARRSKQGTLVVCGVLLAFFSMASAAYCRSWSKNPVSLAQDYAVINDNRGNGEIVLLMWLAPPIVPTSPATEMGRELLDKYIVLGVVHAHFAKDGTTTFDSIDRLEARDGDGHPLTALSMGTMPPAIVGALAALQTAFGRSLGLLGKGTQWFVFNSGDVHPCSHGRLSVPFANEIYTYDTPIPGCPRT